MPSKIQHEINKLKGKQAGEQKILESTLAQIKDVVDANVISISNLDSEATRLHTEVKGQKHQVESVQDKIPNVVVNDQGQITSRLSYENSNSGVAGLDSEGFLMVRQILPAIEQYHNHDGASTNFMTVSQAGNGSSATDAANHELDITTGITAAGRYYWILKPTYTMNNLAKILSVKINNLVLGVPSGSLSKTIIGFKTDLTTNSVAGIGESFIGFYQDQVGNWYSITSTNAQSQSNSISGITDGSILTIVADWTKVFFFVNGTLKATHTLYIPSFGTYMYVGAGVITNAGLTTARSFSVDYFGFMKYNF